MAEKILAPHPHEMLASAAETTPASVVAVTDALKWVEQARRGRRRGGSPARLAAH